MIIVVVVVFENSVYISCSSFMPSAAILCQMLFGDNFVHCDLHPGNVYVKTTTTVSSEAAKEKTNYTIVFLDAGITASLTPQGQRNLRDLFKAVVFNDGETAGRLMVERAQYERCSQVDGGVEAFSKGISEIIAEFHDSRKQGLTLGAVRIGVLLGRVLDQCRLHGVEIDPSMASIGEFMMATEHSFRCLCYDGVAHRSSLFRIHRSFVQ